MGITVQELTTKFHNITDSEIAKLVGKQNFKDNDIIPLNNFATSSKLAYKIFAAQREGLSFLGFLKGQDKINVAKNAGITLLQDNSNNIFCGISKPQCYKPSLSPAQSIFISNHRTA
jgi:hypothetical protein